MADYIEFSRQIKEKYPEYKDVDDRKLAEAMIKKYPVYESQVTFDEPIQEENKGIDITPSGIYKSYRAALEVPATQLREKAVNGRDLSFKEAYKKNREYQEKAPLNKVLAPAVDISAGLALPEIKAVQGAGLLPRLANYGLTGLEQGAVFGGLGGLKEDGIEGILPGVAQGGAIGLGLGAGLPLAGNVAMQGAKLLPMAGGLVARTIGRIQPETLQRAVNPNSKALDLSKNDAQNLLMNTTERVRNAYNNLLSKRGQAVSDATKGLSTSESRILADDLQNDITDLFNQYQGDVVNPARNMTGDLEAKLNELVASAADESGTISPYDLQKIKEQIGKMVNWSDEAARNYQNPILERLYGKYNQRLSDLSPDVANANKEYAQIANFKKNEGLNTILKANDNIDTASSKLRNYNSTVTKGNTGRNIQELENTLVAEGEAPFLNDIDDVNAAMDLLNQRTTGDSWAANLATQLTRPALGLAREFNRRGLPQVFNNVGGQIPRFLVPVLYGGPRLYGGVSND